MTPCSSGNSRTISVARSHLARRATRPATCGDCPASVASQDANGTIRSPFAPYLLGVSESCPPHPPATLANGALAVRREVGDGDERRCLLQRNVFLVMEEDRISDLLRQGGKLLRILPEHGARPLDEIGQDPIRQAPQGSKPLCARLLLA